MREEVWTIVRAAVTEAMSPVVARQKELEAQLESASKARPAAPPVPVAAAAPAPAAQAPAAKSASVPPAKSASIPVSVSTSSPPVATSYGLVMTAQRRQGEIDLAALARAPVDDDGAFSGARRKRMIGRVLVAVILLGLGGLVTMTILSHG